MFKKQKIRIFLAKYAPKLLHIAYLVLDTVRLGPFLVGKTVLPSTQYASFLHKIIAKNSSNQVQQSKHEHLVAYVHGLSSGGAERQWCYLARELSRRNYAVTLLVDSLEGENNHYLYLLDNTNVQVLCIKDVLLSHATCNELFIEHAPYQAKTLGAVLMQLQATHLLCALDNSNIMGVMAANMVNIQKVLISFRNVNPSNFPAFYENWMRPCYHELLAMKNLVWSGNSRYGNDDYATWLGMDKERIKTINNAIDVPKLYTRSECEQFRNELGISPDARVILGVFRLSGEKNVPLFMNVAKAVHKKIPNLIVLHAGVGPLEEEMLELIQKYELQNVVRLLGRRSDILKLMAVADLLLLTSVVEGLPNVVLEAQSMALPVVATRVCGVPEAVIDGESALLAASNDCDSLSTHCIAVLQDENKRKEMGAAGRKFIETTFSHKVFGDRTLNHLELQLEAKNTVKPSDFLTDEGFTYAEIHSLQLLRKFLENKKDFPLAFFVNNSNLFDMLELTGRSICFCQEKTDKNFGKVIQFNWENEHDWASIQDKLLPDDTAVFLDSVCLEPKIRQNLIKVGIKQIIFFQFGKMYLVPTIHPSILKRFGLLLKQYFKRY